MSAKYSVFSIRLTETVGWIPIGITMWCPEVSWVQVRIVSESEIPKDIPKEDHRIIEYLKDDLYRYQSSEYLVSKNLTPSTDEFWDLIRKSMAERLRLSQEFTVLKNPLEGEMVRLFHRIVAPIIDPSDWIPDSKVLK